MSVTITKTKEEATAERKAKVDQVRRLIDESTCPYCGVYSHVSMDIENASDTNIVIGIMASLRLVPDKERRHYHCDKCGAEWIGDWYEC